MTRLASSPRPRVSSRSRVDAGATAAALVAGRIVGFGAEPEPSLHVVRVPGRRVRVSGATGLERRVQIADDVLPGEDRERDGRAARVVRGGEAEGGRLGPLATGRQRALR